MKTTRVFLSHVNATVRGTGDVSRVADAVVVYAESRDPDREDDLRERMNVIARAEGATIQWGLATRAKSVRTRFARA